MKAVKEKRKQEGANKPKLTKSKNKTSRKAVKAFTELVQKQKGKKQPNFKGNLIDGYVEKNYPPSFERLLENHNKGYTKAGVVGSYLITKAKQDCQYKNNISIKNFK